MQVKPKKCRNCKQTFTPKRSTLEVVCSLPCALAVVKKKIAEKEKQATKDFKAKVNHFNRNDPKYVKPKLQTELQAIARTIDSGLPCLATGNFGQIHGGHVFSKGSHPQMRYNLHNIHRQNAQSNHSHNDDGLLREKLAEEYGQEYLEKLKELRKLPPLKLSMPDLYQIYLQAREVHRQLKKTLEPLDKPIPKAMRIRLREEINNKLGIYL